MKRTTAFLLSLLLLATGLSVFALADTDAEPQTLFDISTVTDAAKVSGLIAPTNDASATVTMTFDAEQKLYLLSTKESKIGLPCVFLTPGNIDTERDHWFRGKTLEYEVVLSDILSVNTNPLFELSVYSAGNEEGLTAFVNGDYGPALWWYPGWGICSSNEYPLNGGFSVTAYTRKAVKEATAGVTRRFKMLENDSGMFHYVWDAEAGEWTLLASFAADSLKYCKGTPYIRMRLGDIYGIKSMKLFETPASDNPIHREPGADDTPEAEPTYESNSNYLISMETFRKANNASCYFKGLAQSNGTPSWGGGPSNTVVSYDKEQDMLLFDTRKNTGINGVTLNIPGFDAKENCFAGYTIEFEIVLVDICNVSQLPLMVVGPYYGGFGDCNNGTAIWWYMKDGRFKAANYNGKPNHAAYDGEMKAVEGDSQKFRIVQDEDNLYFYRFVDGDWLIFNLLEASELHFNAGSIWLAFRNGDIYGFRNLAVYKTPEETTDTPPVGEDTTSTEPTPTGTKPASTEEKPTTGAQTTVDPGASSEPKGCESAFDFRAGMMLSLLAVAVLPILRRKKKQRSGSDG